ncbi:MAG: ribonuclease P protein component [Halobacteriovoraceae bacterium]|nr:ribonuclease P protein component [Halobacteriovoraceae bacterium]
MSGLAFSKKFRLLASKEFLYLRTKGKRIQEKFLRGYFCDSNSERTRIGISVSRKVGGAIRRNRVKRILREYFRKSSYRYRGKDLMIIVSPKLFSFYKKQKEAEVALLDSFRPLLNKMG